MFIKQKHFIILISILFMASCTDEYSNLEDYIDQLDLVTLETRDSPNVTSPCVDLCNLGAKACYDWAEHLRDGHLLSCELNLVIGTILVDVYCTQQVIGWVEQVPVYSPEGELIRYDEVIHYVDEEYVCDQVEQNVLSTDPGDLQEFENCRAQALEEFVEEIDKCDIKKISCLKKCKKGPQDEL